MDRVTVVARCARWLDEVKADLEAELIARDDAARRIVEVVDGFGLQPVPMETPPPEITADEAPRGRGSILGDGMILKVNRKKASEHPDAGKTRMIPIAKLPPTKKKQPPPRRHR